MATYDLTVAPYEQSAGFSGIESNQGWSYRKLLGSDLKTLKDGTATSDGDVFKIAKLNRGSMITRVFTIVADADDTSLLLDIGYTDGTNGAATTFETDVNLNATGVTASSDDIIYFPNSGSNYTLDPYLTITPASITNLDNATEFIVGWETVLIQQQIATALTTPV